MDLECGELHLIETKKQEDRAVRMSASAKEHFEKVRTSKES